VPDPIPQPTEALKFLARKKVLETEEWTDIKSGEHSHVFTVAHSAGAGVIYDIFGLMKKAEGEGKSINNFGKELRGIMDEMGWYGRSDKGPNDKDYINFRIKAIYHTNMRTSYAAGKYRQQVRGSSLRPIWQYLSKMVGNRREDHKALHEKAFRWDDPFWNANYPPNGWGCDCSVVSLSEAGAKDVDVLDSNNLPNLINGKGDPVDWNNLAQKEWKYNPGQEALIPNFKKYERLEFCDFIDTIKEKINEDMEKCKLTFHELIAIKNEMEIRKPKKEEGWKESNPVMYLAGTLDPETQELMGIDNGNVMVCGQRIFHGFVDKNNKQRVPKEYYKEVYDLIQNPDGIYKRENVNYGLRWLGTEFHFTKRTADKSGKILNIILRKIDNVAMQITTIALMGDDHVPGQEGHRFKTIRKLPDGI
jgi:SPP1 gp7 family putative phage head morphogenesis protein